MAARRAWGVNHEIQIDGRDRNSSAQLGVVFPCRLGRDARRRHAAPRQAREGKLAAQAGSQSAAQQEGASAGSRCAGSGAGNHTREFQGQPSLTRCRGGDAGAKTLPLDRRPADHHQGAGRLVGRQHDGDHLRPPRRLRRSLQSSVYDQGTKFGIASNSSYFGIRARHNLAPYGYEGYAFLAQIESQVDVAAAPTEKAAFGTRDSFVGIEGPYGTIKAGKADTPYKKATAAFDPFASTVADYNSLMGNTGGDNRAEFDWRMDHAVWYESPIWKGFQFSAMISPGQNYAPDNSDYSYGDLFDCNGASARGSGSNFPNSSGALPGNIGGNGCTDGSFGNAYSAAATYKNGPFTLIAAAELHEGVNRHADDGLE